VPIRTFNDWKDPALGFCEIDMVAHGGTSVAGSFIETLTMVAVATGWAECPAAGQSRREPRRRGHQARTELAPLAVARCRLRQRQCVHERGGRSRREQKLEVTRSRDYKKNDQAFVEQKNGAVVRQLMGYGRFDGVGTARVMARLYAVVAKAPR
jgi:hypothetical protein